MIRFSHIRARNLGVLRDVDVDLDSIPGTLVAVTGPNGSGKSTFLGLLAAGLYREAPTRGSLVDLARSRDASLEVSFVNGAPWTVRHVVDGVAKKSEASAFDADGKLATDSGKVRAFDAWAAKALPPSEVFLSSVFLPQGSRGFLGMTPSERKGVLLRVLGVERLERLADQARERLRAARGELDVLRARVAEVEPSADVEGAETWLRVGEARVEDARLAVAAARTALADEERQLAASEAAWSAEQARAQACAAAGADAKSARAKVEDLGRRIANNREILARADEIRAAAAEEARLRGELVQIEAEEKVNAAAVGEAERREAELAAAMGVSRAAKARARETVRSETDRASEVEKLVTAARAEIEALRPQIEQREAEILRLSAELAALREQHVGGLDDRVAALRAGLHEIVERGTEVLAGFAVGRASDALADDDAAATAAVEVPAKLAAAETALDTARSEVARLTTHLQQAERHAARANDLPEILRRKAEAEAELVRAEGDLDRQRHESDVVSAARTSAHAKAEQTTTRIHDVRAALAAVGAAAKDAEHLARAEARIAELEPQLAEARAGEQAALVRIAELGPPTGATEPRRRKVEEARTRLTEAEGTLLAVEVEQGAKRADVERARAAAARLADLRVGLAKVEADVADWTRLAEDLGRDGLQAAEIDAAGPELTELVNDLLHTCVGPRWTVTVDTQRLSADGKKTLEGLDVRVLDLERGREAPAETLSGGELVLVGEAVSLAITMLACRRSGVTGATLVRDESGAALDPGAARSYVAMLRRACTLVGARQCLFVSHAPEVVDMADARIVLDEGRAVVS